MPRHWDDKVEGLFLSSYGLAIGSSLKRPVFQTGMTTSWMEMLDPSSQGTRMTKESYSDNTFFLLSLGYARSLL
ncbi:hypothetical protein [Wolbachia endosymbiont (group A) of Ennomos erosarius]|uniref:hypothetical protein n=1 Tax=Wolbachia endosymbiont (group A) of Ennomos erosarius TaxID=3066174 RepID=UPI00333E8A1E